MYKKLICLLLIFSLVFLSVGSKTVSATSVESNNDIVTELKSVGRYHRNMNTGEVPYTTVNLTELSQKAIDMGYKNSIPCDIPDLQIDSTKLLDDNLSAKATTGTLTKINPATGGQYRNSVCLLIRKNGATYIGSGFMIGANTVATCGHCLYSYISSVGSYVWADSIQVIPAKANNSYPYGYAWATEIIAPEEWLDDHNTNFDWGIIRLDENLNVGKLGLKTQASSYVGTSVMGNGYPGQINGASNTYMYRYNGTVNSNTSYILKSDALSNPDNGKGMSGGPTYIYSSSTGYTAIALIRGGDSSSVKSVRITNDLYNEFLSYRNLTA